MNDIFDKNEATFHAVSETLYNAFNHNGCNAAAIPTLINQKYDGIQFSFMFQYTDLFTVHVSCMPKVDDKICFEVVGCEDYSCILEYWEFEMLAFEEFDSLLWDMELMEGIENAE